MKIFTIQRLPEVEQTTPGVMSDGNVPFCLTVEREWKDNMSDVSCIFPGEYLCKRVKSPKFGETFEITGAKDRSHVLFHKGNIFSNSKGCVILGEQFEPVAGVFGVQASGKAFEEFMGRLKGENEFKLIIKEAA